MPEFFPVEVVTRPAIRAAGFKVRTSMAESAVDCPRLWSERFSPVMGSFPVDPRFMGESYGISVTVDIQSGVFDYWAAMPIREGAPLPEGMESIVLSEGRYCECRVASLADLPAAYEYVYTGWLPAQNDYDFEYTAPCYELYTSEFMNNGSLAIYCPLAAK